MVGQQFSVSAVISAYNSEKFIRGRLLNLIEQSLFKQGKLEIIVIDSCSPQNERQIAEEFLADYPQIVYRRTTERESVYKAWNRGIELAKGRYFINANSDDRFSPAALEMMARELDLDDSIDAVYGDWLITRLENDSFDSPSEKLLFNYPEFYPYLYFYYQISSHAAMIRMSVFERIGLYDPAFVVYGDREFMLRFAASGCRAKKLPEVTGLYLDHPDSIEHSNFSWSINEFQKIITHFLRPEKIIRLAGYSEVPDSFVLSRFYSAIGFLGKRVRGTEKKVSLPGEASLFLTEALKLDSSNLTALNNLAIINHLFGLPGQNLFKIALELFPADKAVQKNIAMAGHGSRDADDFSWLAPAPGFFYYFERNWTEKVNPAITFLIKLLVSPGSSIISYKSQVSFRELKAFASLGLTILPAGELSVEYFPGYSDEGQFKIIDSISRCDIYDFAFALNIKGGCVKVREILDDLFKISDVAIISFAAAKKGADFNHFADYIKTNFQTWFHTTFADGTTFYILAASSPGNYPKARPLISLIFCLKQQAGLFGQIKEAYQYAVNLHQELVEYQVMEYQSSEFSKVNEKNQEHSRINYLSGFPNILAAAKEGISRASAGIVLLQNLSTLPTANLLEQHVKYQALNQQSPFMFFDKAVKAPGLYRELHSDILKGFTDRTFGSMSILKNCCSESFFSGIKFNDEIELIYRISRSGIKNIILEEVESLQILPVYENELLRKKVIWKLLEDFG